MRKRTSVNAHSETHELKVQDPETKKVRQVIDRGTTASTNGLNARDLILAVVLCLVSFVTYSPTFDAEFVWDDRAAIVGNKDVVTNSSWKEIFKHDFWGGNIASRDSHKSYRPFCVFTFRLNYQWYGLEAGGYHFWNVILHACTCVLFYVFSRTLWSQNPAALSSMLFAVHPVHTEAVAGLVGRADIVACFFMIASIIVYSKSVEGADKPDQDIVMSWIYVFCAVVTTVIAALFKEIGATAFCLMVAYEVFFVIRPYPRFSYPNRGSLLRIAVVCIATFFFLKARLSLHANHNLRVWRIMENHIPLANSTLTRTLTTIKSHGRYTRLLIWPSNLSYDHGFSATPWIESLWDPSWLEGFFAYIFVILCGIYALYAENRVLQLSLAMLIVPFLPASNIFFYVGTVLAERLLYVPSMGYCIYAGYVLYLPLASENEVLCAIDVNEGKRRNDRIARSVKSMSPKKIFRYSYTLVLIVGFTSMAYHTYIRNFDWKTEESIYESGYREEPDSVKILNNLAQVLLRDGNKTKAKRAEQILQRSLEINPNYPSGYYNRALAFSTLRNHDKAIELFNKALDMGLEASAGNCNAYLAQEYMHIYYDLKGKGLVPDEQLLMHVQTALNKAFDLKCQMPLLHFTTANVLAEVGQHENSLQYYENALKLNSYKYLEPGTKLVEADVRNQYALALSKMNLVDRALEQWKVVKALNPDGVASDINAAVLLSDHGRSEEAIDLLKSATAMHPDHPIVWNNLGSIEEGLGRYNEALEHFQKAYQFAPEHTTIRNNVHRLQALVAGG